MSAYWITTYKAVHDPDKVAAYAAIAGPALTAAGGTFLVRGMPEATFEKGETTRTVVIEFPSVEAAVAAHDSEAYQEALRALDGGADRDMRVVPGA
ncbi:DUF1330 domain-containing protein [Nocardioides oleivorans]|uniref:DUF1330 domain-containing protein n=1 Tax=Nocardioides oleivorans TaxID=273676 RepID=A0A4Q2RWH9_9ACTN|nr:DUF1330 domain-containing protein [Nocardioides oleivorans]RYB93561.1 DUF1330 domain-containing protein [Nocardioides oleivorans]